jgi:hypothetical protein
VAPFYSLLAWREILVFWKLSWKFQIPGAKFVQVNPTLIPSLGNFINTKLEIKKTNPTIIISTFKTDKTIVGIVFFISIFFTNKISGFIQILMVKSS